MSANVSGVPRTVRTYTGYVNGRKSYGAYASRALMAVIGKKVGKELGKIAAKEAADKAGKQVTNEAAKWIAELIAKVAERFGIVVTEKFAAQAVPVIGAVAGAGLNTLFIDFYQDMARGHFIVKRLEGVYGGDAVKAAYKKYAEGR